MKKIVVSKCFGGFGVSTQATLLLRELKNTTALSEVMKGEWYTPSPRAESLGGGEFPKEINKYDFNAFCLDIPRDDKDLISLIEKHGSEFVSGTHAQLEIVEIPNDVEWLVEEYDGLEHVAEKHRTWM